MLSPPADPPDSSTCVQASSVVATTHFRHVFVRVPGKKYVQKHLRRNVSRIHQKIKRRAHTHAKRERNASKLRDHVQGRLKFGVRTSSASSNPYPSFKNPSMASRLARPRYLPWWIERTQRRPPVTSSHAHRNSCCTCCQRDGSSIGRYTYIYITL